MFSTKIQGGKKIIMIRYKHCPFCKAALEKHREHYQCPDCGKKIYINSKPTASIFPIEKGKLLLSKRGIEPYKYYYDAIGGFLKPGEHPEDGAVREAKEETGLDIKLTKFLGVYMDVYGKGGDDTINFYYVAKILRGKMEAKEDVTSLHWFPINNLPKKIAFKNTKDAFKNLKKWYERKLKAPRKATRRGM